MAFQKTIDLGSGASLSITEGAGSASVGISAGASLGGGEVAGIAKVKVAAEADIEDTVLVGLIFDYAAAKVPAAAELINDAKAAVLAELSV